MKDEQSDQIVTTKNKTYSFFQKLICCRCFTCCQQKNILTSNIRKRTLQRMLSSYVVDEQEEEVLYDPVQLMILIYLCQDDLVPERHIAKCRIGPNVGISTYRTDLQFYIPQMCNYIVFYRDLKPSYLSQALEQICKLSIYFAHLYYFYMRSIEKTITTSLNETIKPVQAYNQYFMKQMENRYSSASNALDMFKTGNIQHHESKMSIKIKEYGTNLRGNNQLIRVKVEQIDLPLYRVSFVDKQKKNSNGFMSTIDFFNDLFVICEDLKNYTNKKEKLIEFLAEINYNLPAAIYIPFSKNSYRLCNILKIVLSETKIFSTKERAPFCICVQIFCPAEKLSMPQQQRFWQKVQFPYTLKKSLQSVSKIRQSSIRQGQFNPHSTENKHSIPARMSKQQHISSNIQDIRKSFHHINIRDSFLYRDLYSDSINTQMQSERDSTDLKNNLLGYETNQVHVHIENKIELSDFKKTNKEQLKKKFNKLFGEELFDTKVRISSQSIFGNFFSWDIIHLIIKTNDDLKQQQFALQLIYQFDYIFKLEKLPLILTPYEVLSMGPDCGIIEMVKDAVTFDSLKKNLFQCKCTLKQFFEIYFKDGLVKAKDTFMKSLAAYSLVMYFIQAKDRHNGNILLHRSGKMFHIDFGFFLSNMPGKGIELERDCPFKLLSEHIQVLDGVDSYYFSKFREYFFLGFKAVQKHQNKILMLVKMMYSSGGMMMPCFQKGEQAIIAMQNRINPPGVENDPLLNSHCQKLINLSLDNWASRWYDRFQYWAQGIFY